MLTLSVMMRNLILHMIFYCIASDLDFVDGFDSKSDAVTLLGFVGYFFVSSLSSFRLNLLKSLEGNEECKEKL